jgi:hypothetical protein
MRSLRSAQDSGLRLLLRMRSQTLLYWSWYLLMRPRWSDGGVSLCLMGGGVRSGDRGRISLADNHNIPSNIRK